MNALRWAYVGIMVLLWACDNSPYAGYEEKNGIHYQLISLGDGSVQPDSGDFLVYSWKLESNLPEMVLNGAEFSEQTLSGRISEDIPWSMILGEFELGDSLSLIIDDPRKFDPDYNGDSARNVIESPALKVAVRLLALYKDSTYFGPDKYRPFLLEQMEWDLLRDYLEINRLLMEDHFYRGVFIDYLDTSGTHAPDSGDMIRLSYVATFVNGTEFDNTEKWEEDFVFQYGKPHQVIRGLEIAISTLKEGNEAKIIIPSQLAFGDGGSSSGIVPPYSTVIYHVKVDSVYTIKETNLETIDQ